MADEIARRLADAGLRVKPLAFRDTYGDGVLFATVFGGLYTVSKFGLRFQCLDAEGVGTDSYSLGFPENFASAAHADYTARILAALEMTYE